LLETFWKTVSKDSEYGRTPLLLAAENGHDEVVKQLLVAGKVDVDSYSYGRMPLSWAGRNGHEVVAKQLLETAR
jgi:ankyrin repeat protein